MIEASLEEAEAWRAAPVTQAMFQWLSHQIGVGKEAICNMVFDGRDPRAEAGRLRALIIVRQTLATFGTEVRPEEEPFTDPATRDTPHA